MIVGTGIDLVAIDRIARAIQRHGQPFLDRIFTPAEQAYCSASRASAERFAARFAAKEALAKALGTGIASGINWTDLEVARSPDGQPRALLHRAAADRAHALSVTAVHLSLSHDRTHAVAQAILESAPHATPPC